MLHTQWYDSTRPAHVPKVSSAPLGSSCSPLAHPPAQHGTLRTAASFALMEALRENRRKREGNSPQKRRRQSVCEGGEAALSSLTGLQTRPEEQLGAISNDRAARLPPAQVQGSVEFRWGPKARD